MHSIKLQVLGPWNQSVDISNDKTVEENIDKPSVTEDIL